MGVTLYRPGGQRNIKGIKCEMQTFDEYSYLHNLEDGWFYSPEECYPEKEPEKIITEEKAIEEDTDLALSLDDMPDTEVRQLAKEKSIKNWYNKKIDTLKTEIKAWQPEI